MSGQRLIVNADDFGWADGVNQGIIQSHAEGILTSTTLLVNFPRMDAALEMARDFPGLGIGLHFNIVHGPPVASPEHISSLLDRSGHFAGAATILRRILTRRVSREHLQAEFKAQLARFCKHAGRPPTHIDSHKHMHLFAPVREAITSMATDLAGMPIRSTARGENTSSPTSAKFRLLQHLGKLARKPYHDAGFRCVDDFLGMDQLGTSTPEKCLAILASARSDLTELMCHPGLASGDEHSVVANVNITAERKTELASLTDPSVKAFVSDSGIALVNYGNLAA